MSSIILELQRDALDNNIRVSDLLRKALVVARKLKLTEFQEWVEKELNGYEKVVPEYREVSGFVKGWNPYRGWIPLIFEDPKVGEKYSKRGNSQSIAEIESMVENREKKSQLVMPFPQHIQRKLSEGFGFETEIMLFCSNTELVGILDMVRNIVLNWALELEEQGILGEGLAFSEKEKSVAIQSPHNITNYYGSVHSAQISQGNQQAIQIASIFQYDKAVISKFVENLSKAVPELGLNSESKSELNSEIATVKAQLGSPNPKKSIIKESLASIRRIMEGAGGSVAGQLLLELGKLMID